MLLFLLFYIYTDFMKKKTFLSMIIIFSVIFLCHFVIFMAFYPGICSYDLGTQIGQYVNHAFRTNHPLIHTLFIGFFHGLFANESHNFNYNLGYALATIIQMIIVDSSMTYSVLYLKDKCTSKLPVVLTTVFYALFPINSLLTISHTKDVLFSALSLVFLIDSLNLISKKSVSFRSLSFVRIIINATIMLLLRNNAVYAMLATIIIICIVCFVSHKKKIANKHMSYAAILILSVVLSLISNKALIFATQAYPGSIKEMMSIPAQIMGRIYNTTATEEEKEIISSYIPNTDDYNYYLADSMKRNLRFEIWELKCKHFLLDSTIIALKHPIISFQAIWFNIQGYVDPLHQPYSSDHFFLARHDYSGDAIQETKLPVICNCYVDHFRVTNPDNPLTIFLNAAIYVLTFVIAFCVLFKRHNKESLAYLFGLFYLFTLLLGPGAIIRYAFLYVLSCPIALRSIFSKD